MDIFEDTITIGEDNSDTPGRSLLSPLSPLEKHLPRILLELGCPVKFLDRHATIVQKRRRIVPKTLAFTATVLLLLLFEAVVSTALGLNYGDVRAEMLEEGSLGEYNLLAAGICVGTSLSAPCIYLYCYQRIALQIQEFVQEFSACLGRIKVSGSKCPAQIPGQKVVKWHILI